MVVRFGNGSWALAADQEALLFSDHRSHGLSLQYTGESTWCEQVKDDDGEPVLHAQGERSGIHDFQA